MAKEGPEQWAGTFPRRHCSISATINEAISNSEGAEAANGYSWKVSQSFHRKCNTFLYIIYLFYLYQSTAQLCLMLMLVRGIKAGTSDPMR